MSDWLDFLKANGFELTPSRGAHLYYRKRDEYTIELRQDGELFTLAASWGQMSDDVQLQFVPMPQNAMGMSSFTTGDEAFDRSVLCLANTTKSSSSVLAWSLPFVSASNRKLLQQWTDHGGWASVSRFEAPDSSQQKYLDSSFVSAVEMGCLQLSIEQVKALIPILPTLIKLLSYRAATVIRQGLASVEEAANASQRPEIAAAIQLHFKALHHKRISASTWEAWFALLRTHQWEELVPMLLDFVDLKLLWQETVVAFFGALIALKPDSPVSIVAHFASQQNLSVNTKKLISTSLFEHMAIDDPSLMIALEELLPSGSGAMRNSSDSEFFVHLFARLEEASGDVLFLHLCRILSGRFQNKHKKLYRELSGWLSRNKPPKNAYTGWADVDPGLVMGSSSWIKTASCIANISNQRGGALEQRLLRIAETLTEESEKLEVIGLLSLIATTHSIGLLTPYKGWFAKGWLHTSALRDAADEVMVRIQAEAGGPGALSVATSEDDEGHLSLSKKD